MATVIFNNESFSCVTAIKGEDYIRLLDNEGLMIAAFECVKDFDAFEIADGDWTSPSVANCCVAVFNEDGTLSRGGRIANSVVLTAAGWSNNLQTVALDVMTGTKNIVVSPAPESYVAYGEAGVYCSAQGVGTLTFACDDVPDGDLAVNILVIGG